MLTIGRGRTRVTVAPESGGRIAQIEMHDGAAWLPLLHAPDEPASPLAWGSYVMAPWPNRIANGRFQWAGRPWQMPANEPPHALHGLAFDAPWTVVDADDASCELALTLDGPPPYAGARITQRIMVEDDALTQQMEIEATRCAFPAGAGWHPWFRRDLGSSRDVRVKIDADERYELDGMIATGRMLRVDGEHDLRGYPLLGERRLDDCYRLAGNEMCICWGAVELTMQSSPNVRHAVVYTPEHAVCVEPQSCAIDAFNLEARGVAGNGTTIVTPDAPLVAWTAWRWLVGDRW